MQPQAQQQQQKTTGAAHSNGHATQSIHTSGKYSLKNRTIASCLTCRARKVKCDKGRPSCSQCRRRQRPCTYVDTDKQKESAHTEATQHSIQLSLKDRVKRLESFVSLALADPNRLLSEAAAGAASERARNNKKNIELPPISPTSKVGALSLSDPEHNTPSSNADSDGHTASSEPKFRGALLLEDGKAQFFSPVHWTMMGEEIQGLKDLLNDDVDKADISSASDDSVISPWKEGDEMDDDKRSLSYLAFRHGSSTKSLLNCYPETAQDCHVLLETFITHVDPMVRIVHRPTIRQQFCEFVKLKYGLDELDHREAPKSFEPMFFAIVFSGIHSMTNIELAQHFQLPRDTLIHRYQRGLEMSLSREDFMVSQKLEVFQAFVLFITLICKEDDMQRSWALTGLAIRIAQGLGLHRDPLNFPSGRMDQVQVETRRRLWHQICHLDLRSSEAQGHEPFITDDFYDTRYPRNVNDEDIIAGHLPCSEAPEVEAFTDITLSLVRFHAMATLRKLLHLTFGGGRLGFSNSSPENLQPVHGDGPKSEDELAVEVSALFEDMSARNKKFISWCNPNIFEQRFTAGLIQVMESKFWVIFYHRYSRAYREEHWSMEFRRKILHISVSCIFSVKSALIESDPRFNWHVNSYVGLHAAVHIISELCSPSFQTPEDTCLRERCWQAIDYLKEKNADRMSKPWTMMQKMIWAAEQQHRPRVPPVLCPAAAAAATPEEPMEVKKVDLGMNQLNNFTNNNLLQLDEMPIYPNISMSQNSEFDWEQWDMAMAQYNDVLRGLPVL